MLHERQGFPMIDWFAGVVTRGGDMSIPGPSAPLTFSAWPTRWPTLAFASPPPQLPHSRHGSLTTTLVYPLPQSCLTIILPHSQQ